MKIYTRKVPPTTDVRETEMKQLFVYSVVPFPEPGLRNWGWGVVTYPFKLHIGAKSRSDPSGVLLLWLTHAAGID